MPLPRPARALAGALAIAAMTDAAAADAPNWPAPREATWIARDFRFASGETMAELKLHYRTIGEPSGEPVLVLHGTNGTGAALLTPQFAGQLFGPGQPLDARRHFLILPDAIGAGKSSKPSDGLRMKFPRYTYEDMVVAQHRLVTEALGVKRLRLVIGNSMGGMHAWLWGVTYPAMMDAIVPMASMPSAMSGRNWIMRRMIIDAIRSDPEWKNGDYAVQPPGAKFASVFYALAMNGGNQALQHAAPDRAKADALLAERMAAPFPQDANDLLYQWESSRDYDPSPGLGRIEAAVLAINAADDERNPPELGVMERELKRIRNARLHLVPASDRTAGHGTTGNARWWKQELEAFLAGVPRR